MKLVSGLIILATLIYTRVAYTQVLIPGDIQNDIFRLSMLETDAEDKPIVITPSILTYYNLDSLSFAGWERLLYNTKKTGNGSFKIVNPSSMLSYNSKYARGMNDGAVWQGKGLNSSLNVGFTGSKGKFHYAFVPVIYFAQNQAYRIDRGPYDKNPYQYPFGRGIDWVLRYGDNSLADFGWGQSEIRFIEKNFTIGLSTQNFILGPSVINPILMSNNAPGFPHIDIGTATPVRTKAGDLEFRVYWGVLTESSHFDNQSDNDLRYLNGWSLGYRPSFLEGLSLGLTRIKYRDMPDGWRLGAGDFFTSFSYEILKDPDPIVLGGQNDLYDQMAAITLKWAFPEVGFEFYAEYAKNDFPGSISGLLELPDRSRGYNIGFMKVNTLKNGAKLLINYEHTTLANNQTIINNITPTFYDHNVVRQGYTNNGQILGASVGPGANADFFRVNYYHQKYILGFNYHRNRHNDDYLVRNFPFGDPPHDVEHSLDFSYARQFNDLFIDAHFNVTARRNWYFDTSVNTFFNIQPSVRLTYLLP